MTQLVCGYAGCAGHYWRCCLRPHAVSVGHARAVDRTKPCPEGTLIILLAAAAFAHLFNTCTECPVCSHRVIAVFMHGTCSCTTESLYTLQDVTLYV